MNRAETSAACHVAANVVVEATTAVEGVHRGILSRIRGTTARAAPGLAAWVDGIELPARLTYAAVRSAGTAAGHAGAAAAAVLVDDHATSAAHTAQGATRLAGLGAALGDRLAGDDRARALMPVMAFRRDGVQVPPSEAAAADAAGLMVFVHGLAGTEFQWDPAYQDAARSRGLTAAFVRYNSGRPIHANGADLAELLAAVHAALPAQRSRLVLVGHSMGGLVLHSALAQAGDAPWVESVTHLVTLGSPHGGAPLEKAAALLLAGLRRFRESEPIAAFGDQRSIGIKDLRFGAMHPQDWGGRDPNDVLRDPTTSVPLPEHIEHHAVVGLLGRPGGLRGSLLGDGMVRARSAAGGGAMPQRSADPRVGDSRRHQPQDSADRSPRRIVHRLYGVGHLQLLSEPSVAQLLVALGAPAVPQER